MIITIEPASPVPIYSQIVRQVRAAVAAGELRPGDALPSVRQLAVELRVNPNTVAQAYRELEREGLTYVQRGQGTFVAEVSSERKDRDREELGRLLVRRMLDEAFRLGLSTTEVHMLVQDELDRTTERASATGPAGSISHLKA